MRPRKTPRTSHPLVDAQHIPARVGCCPQWISTGAWVCRERSPWLWGNRSRSGVFLTPAAMAKSLGAPLLLAAVWCGMGLITLCGALCYSELAVRYPLAGGEYVYLREGYGSRVAFLYGWMSAAVLDPGLAAALGGRRRSVCALSDRRVSRVTPFRFLSSFSFL